MYEIVAYLFIILGYIVVFMILDNNYKKKNGALVVMANVIIRAKHNLTLQEKRLINLAISKSHGYNSGIRITAHDFAEKFNLDLKNAFRELKRIQTSLKTKTIDFPIYIGNSTGMASIPWLKQSLYLDGRGYVELEFSDKIAPHLFEQKEKFTAYDLKKGIAFKRVSSWRLLEQIERNANHIQDKNGFIHWYVSIQELHKTLEATKSYKAQFGQFKRRVIEPAIKELKEKGGWDIQWEAYKEGRKVKFIDFRFKKIDIKSSPKG